LSITTPDDRTYSFEVRVVADLHVLRGQLQCLFPDASLKLGQVRDHIVVEGQARDAAQVARILETIRAYLASVRATEVSSAASQMAGSPPVGIVPPAGPAKPGAGTPPDKTPPGTPLLPERGDPTGYTVSPELGRVAAARASVAEPTIINLIRVPGSQQV